MSRWMPVYEDDMTHWLWDNPRRYQWWLEIRFRAAKCPGMRFVAGIPVHVSYGEWPVSVLSLSNHWKASEKTVKTFLEILCADGLVELHRQGNVTIIKVLGFERYCFSMPKDASPTDTRPEAGIESHKEQNDEKTNDEIESDDPAANGAVLSSGQKAANSKSERPSEHLDKRPNGCTDILYNKENREKKEDSVDKERMREEKFFNQIKNSKSSIESIALALHCKIEDVVPLLEDFYNSKVAIEEWHNSIPAFKKHFINWATIRLQNQNNDENSAKNKPAIGYRQYARNRRGPITPDCGLIED